MTTTALTLLLPPGGPDAATPVVLPHSVRVAAAPVPAYGDETWRLDALGLAPGGNGVVLAWRAAAPGLTGNKARWAWTASPLLVEGCRNVAWLLINVARPGEHGHGEDAEPVRSAPLASTVRSHVSRLRRLADFLHDRGVDRFADADGEALMAYRQHVLDSDVGDKARFLAAVVLLWEYAPHLPEHARLHFEPPWLAEGPRAARVPIEDDGQNGTEPIHPGTMSPLLLWSLRFVEDFADDIVRAWEEYQRVHAAVPADQNRDRDADRAVVVAYVERLRAQAEPLPGRATPQGREVANRYIASILGVPYSIANQKTSPAISGMPVGTRTPLDSPITGTVHGAPWVDSIDYSDAPTMVTRLVAACEIVVLYLSGMRPEEVLALRVGCCPEPVGPDLRHRVHGVYFKHAKDEQGRRAVEGIARSWVVVPPVRRAITVMEGLVGGTAGMLLFPAAAPWARDRRSRKSRVGHAEKTSGVNKNIARLIMWINVHAEEHGLHAEAVPACPDGKVTASRFRRTVAWFVFRRPRGRIALGVQYGHLDLATTDGYGNRLRDLDGVLAVERARALAASLERAADAADRGEHVSGPAAGYNAQAVDGYQAEYRGTMLGDRQLKRLANDPTKQVRHDPDLLLSCNPQRGKMACVDNRPLGVERTPDLLNCRPNCACISRTDSDVALLIERRDAHRVAADSGVLPGPLADRLRQQADSLATLIERHEQTRPVIGGSA